MKNNLEKASIQEIICAAKENDESAYYHIIEIYKGIVHGTIKNKGYFLPGGDYNDLFQEGLFGIYKAIKDFDISKINTEEKKAKKNVRPDSELCEAELTEKKIKKGFESFLKKCVERQLINAIKMATRKKHSPLNKMIPLDQSLPENDNLSMMDIFGARDEIQYAIDFESLDPEEQLILKETKLIQQKMLDQELSEKEKKVFYSYLEDKTYKEIMEDLNETNPKMIDNAIQRVKERFE